MKELRCPHCDKTFTVDESEYAELLNQVRNDAFNREVERRSEEMKKTFEAMQTAAVSKALEAERKEKSALALEIEKLKGELSAAKNNVEQSVEMAVLKAEQEHSKELQGKVLEISNLRSQMEINKERAEVEKNSIKSEYEGKLKSERESYGREMNLKDEVIAQYKDFKTKMSTKMIGESLEVYCHNQYDTMVRPYLPEADFHKDNEAVDHTKGDFVFRDIVDGVESVSIMFEMKNEADATETKHKNEDFYSKLNSDRNKKNCEFAVLVSMLELDNDLFNNGIYSVPGYEKMYVVRPQQFLSIISLLVQMGRNTAEIKKELADAKNKEIDVTRFEEKLEKFKGVFGGHVADAANRYNDSIKDIDAAIAKLQEMKENLRLWVDHLYKADKNLDDLTIRALTYQNPTMKAKFADAREGKAAEAEEMGEENED